MASTLPDNQDIAEYVRKYYNSDFTAFLKDVRKYCGVEEDVFVSKYQCQLFIAHHPDGLFVIESSFEELLEMARKEEKKNEIHD